MLSPEILLNSIAEKLRLIPELAQIPVHTYDERFPIENDLLLAIWKLKPPSILVLWRGTSPGAKDRMEAWRHSYSLVLRSANETTAGPYNYFYLWLWIMNGVPADGMNCNFRHSTFHEACYQMQAPSILRQTVFVTPESRLDYHEVFISIDEKGDF